MLFTGLQRVKYKIQNQNAEQETTSFALVECSLVSTGVGQLNCDGQVEQASERSCEGAVAAIQVVHVVRGTRAHAAPGAQ